MVFCSIEHFGFMVLEMFLWKTPTGLRIFGNTAEKAADSAVLAMNQGLYNGFIAAGLLYGLCITDVAVQHAFRFFFLSCIVIAGVFGGLTVKPRIMYVQAVPAALAMLALFFSEPHG
jgi:putative membrane protein